MFEAREPLLIYQLTIVQKPTYLQAIVSGLNSRENVARYLAEVLRECTERGYFRVLIEERLEGPRLGTMDVFEIAAQGQSKVQERLKAIAYVDVHAEGDLMRFAETVAVNRGLHLSVFATVADAEEWLQDEEGGGAEPQGPVDAEKLRR